MLCNICQKREAKIYYTEIINGEKKEQHLCEECAAEHTTFFVMDTLQNKELFLGSLLAGLLEGCTAGLQQEKKTETGIVCKQCGMPLETFLKSGHFGCAQCYDSFGKNLPRLLRNIHGGDTHNGKRPKGYCKPEHEHIEKPSLLTAESRLQLKLQQAIEKEEYEEAARIRDEIRSLPKEAAHE